MHALHVLPCWRRPDQIEDTEAHVQRHAERDEEEGAVAAEQECELGSGERRRRLGIEQERLQSRQERRSCGRAVENKKCYRQPCTPSHHVSTHGTPACRLRRQLVLTSPGKNDLLFHKPMAPSTKQGT